MSAQDTNLMRSPGDFPIAPLGNARMVVKDPVTARMVSAIRDTLDDQALFPSEKLSRIHDLVVNRTMLAAWDFEAPVTTATTPSLMRRLGLNRHDISRLAASRHIKHTERCRDFNPRGNGEGYHCVCEFFTKIIAAAFEEFGRAFSKEAISR